MIEDIKRSEVKIMKKNKDIEIRMEDTSKVINGTTYEVTELHIGKKKIGEVLEYAPKDFHSFMDNEDLGSSKTMEIAVETIIRQWNLHE